MHIIHLPFITFLFTYDFFVYYTIKILILDRLYTYTISLYLLSTLFRYIICRNEDILVKTKKFEPCCQS